MDVTQKVNCLKIAADLAKTVLSGGNCDQQNLLKAVKENYEELHKLVNGSFQLDDIETSDLDAAADIAAEVASDIA